MNQNTGDRSAIIINDIISIIGHHPYDWNDIINDNYHFFANLNIFQTRILQFIQEQIDIGDVSNIIITNIDEFFDIISNNLQYLKIEFYKITFQKSNSSICIPIFQCWSIPSSPHSLILNNFYNNLISENNIIRWGVDYFIISLNHYICYLNIINNNNNNNNNNSNSTNIKYELSDIIFDQKDNMTDSAFKIIMEKIAAL